MTENSDTRIPGAKRMVLKASFMTRTSDTVSAHLQRCRTLGDTGRTQRLFPPPQAASVRPRFEPTVTPPSRVTSQTGMLPLRTPIHHPSVHVRPPDCACAKSGYRIFLNSLVSSRVALTRGKIRLVTLGTEIGARTTHGMWNCAEIIMPRADHGCGNLF